MADMDFETPLAAWMRREAVSPYEVARRTGISYKQICQYRDGRALPSLVSAFKIERATNGAVSPVLWLGTPLGRHHWEKRTDWDKWQETRKRAAKKQREEIAAVRLPLPAAVDGAMRSPAPAAPGPGDLRDDPEEIL